LKRGRRKNRSARGERFVFRGGRRSITRRSFSLWGNINGFYRSKREPEKKNGGAESR